jgi:DNA-binding CsgD family transcriptional regulator
MITLHDSNHYSLQQWLLFKKQFNLTPAEARLCRSFADGLTLNDYCEQWKVATCTARSQLHSVFGKTSTHSQSNLLRLIFLFSRTFFVNLSIIWWMRCSDYSYTVETAMNWIIRA